MKPFWQSKTVWLGAISALIAICDQVRPFIPAEWMPKFMAAVGILTIIFRVFSTSKPINQPTNRK